MPGQFGTAGKRLDLLIDQGSLFTLPLQATLDDAGTPRPLAGCTILAQIRKTPTSTTLVATLNYSITDAVNGLFSLILTAAQTAAITTGDTVNDLASRYVWDCKLTLADGLTVIPLAWGVVNVQPGVSRP